MDATQQHPRVVLLVDDEPAIRTSFSRAAPLARYTLHTAASVDDAWPYLREGVDVLVSDLRLGPPGEKDGLDLISSVAVAQLPKTPRIIAISAVATPADAFALAAAGARLFLEKPFTAEELQDAIEEICETPDSLELLVAAQLGARTLPEVEQMVRKTMIEQALARCDGNQRAAALLLGLTRQRVNQILKGK